MEDYLQDLNPQQYDAVTYDGGPSLVIAGAGSGKTRVLTNKIMYLIRSGYNPKRILALTFTNKAAAEMRDRITALIGDAATGLWVGTFHSMFLKILRFNAERIGFRLDFTIYDTADSKVLIKSIIKNLGLNDKDYPVNAVASTISSVKNALISPSDYQANIDFYKRDRYKNRPLVGEIYRIYQERCKVADAMDFDDILFFTNVLFRDNEDVLKKYQEFFQYILVDEYQDTNFSQHRIVAQLGNLSRKICVVGDDAQSIYSFRGANINNILNLNKLYPDLKVFKLEQNYRSTQNILDAANSLIAKNTKQIPKRIFSTNAKGSKIEVIEAYSDFEESYIVANKISETKMLQSGSFNDFAILYRTNAQSRVFEESLRKRNIPYRIYGGLSFYQRKEIKDALCYFRMAVNPNDDEALCRIINYPMRGIGEATVGKLRTTAVAQNLSIWDILCDLSGYDIKLNSGTIKKLDSFRNLIQGFISSSQELDAFELASKIYYESGLTTSLQSDNTPENISRQENLNELLSAIRQFVNDTKEENGETNIQMANFLSVVSLATDQDKNEDNSQPKVTLMTVHSAKGLEFKNVFIVGVEDELFPSLRAYNDLQEIEEERRLMYVAITRAKTNCIITYALTRYRNGATHPCTRSRFIDDIDPRLIHSATRNNLSQPRQNIRQQNTNGSLYNGNQLIFSNTKNIIKPMSPTKNMVNSEFRVYNPQELNVGMKVRHSNFGLGVIIQKETSGNDTKVTIRFDNVGTKVLLTKFAKLNIVE